MKKTLSVCCILAIAGSSVYAQNKKAPAAKNDFIKLEGGLEYKIIKDAPTEPSPNYGDYIEMHLLTKLSNKDSIIYSTRAMNNNLPVQFPLTQPQFKGDIVNAFKYLSAGDSAVITLPIDSVLATGAPEQPWMTKGAGQKLIYTVNMVSVKTAAQMKQEQETKAAAQKGVDDKIIQDYLAKNNIKASKTESGLYYKVDKEGTGAKPTPGQKVTVNYTGKFLDGEAFDSNLDPKFQHVQPFDFPLGQGRVIKGWDEGIALFSKGGKGTLYIPSTLAYGSNAQGPIKANSVLMFDIELVDITADAPAPTSQFEAAPPKEEAPKSTDKKKKK